MARWFRPYAVAALFEAQTGFAGRPFTGLENDPRPPSVPLIERRKSEAG